jgi:hypothetical protein
MHAQLAGWLCFTCAGMAVIDGCYKSGHCVCPGGCPAGIPLVSSSTINIYPVPVKAVQAP